MHVFLLAPTGHATPPHLHTFTMFKRFLPPISPPFIGRRQHWAFQTRQVRRSTMLQWQPPMTSCWLEVHGWLCHWACPPLIISFIKESLNITNHQDLLFKRLILEQSFLSILHLFFSGFPNRTSVPLHTKSRCVAIPEMSGKLAWTKNRDEFVELQLTVEWIYRITDLPRLHIYQLTCNMLTWTIFHHKSPTPSTKHSYESSNFPQHQLPKSLKKKQVRPNKSLLPPWDFLLASWRPPADA